MDGRDDVNLRVFNTAKVFAESILFPLMERYKKFQRQANFGSDELNDSMLINEEIRDIQRFNGIKAMAETVHDLLNAISSTVRLKTNRQEIAKLDELLITIKKAKLLFYYDRDRFFILSFRNGRQTDIIDRDYFERVKDIIENNYINTEILMTRNKLLFSDAGDEYLNDYEIKEAIRKEYIDN